MRSRRISRPDSLSFSVVFVVIVAAVLIIGMGSPAPTHPSAVDLARTHSPINMPAADREDALVLAIMRDGTIFFRSEKVKPEVLAEKIRSAIGMHTERKVYIKADAHVGYRWVKVAIDAIHDASIEHVAFVTEKQKSGAQ